MPEIFGMLVLGSVPVPVQTGVEAGPSMLDGNRSVTASYVAEDNGKNVPCRIGNANAAVFPLPVSARPMTSRPCSACGIAST